MEQEGQHEAPSDHRAHAHHTPRFRLSDVSVQNAYKGRCKIDWDLWRDEDDIGDEKDAGDFGAGGMPGMVRQQRSAVG